MRKFLFLLLFLAGCATAPVPCPEGPSKEDKERTLEVRILMAKNFSGFVCDPNDPHWMEFDGKKGQYFTCIRYDGLVTQWAVIDEGNSFTVSFIQELNPASELPEEPAPGLQSVGN